MNDQVLLEERARRLERVIAGTPVIHARPLQPVLPIAHALSERVRSALNVFLWQCLAQAQPNKSFALSDDMLRHHGAEIAALPNVTPNGLMLPKRENSASFNMVQKEAIAAFDALGIGDRIARVQYPVNIRMQSGHPDVRLDRRPRASSKPHSDIWAGEPSSGILVFLSLLGDPNVSGIHFYRPRAFPESFVRTLEDFDDGQSLMEDATEISRFDQSGWFLADSYVLHKTVRAGSGLRISLDFRFIPKERISSDNDEDATRRPFFLSIAEWRRIGSSMLITTQESMHGFNPAAKKDPYTIGYPVRISLVDTGRADHLPSPSMPPAVVSCDRDVAPAFVAGKLGVSIDELQRLLGNRPWPRLAYRILQNAERDDIIRHVLERIEMAELRVVGDNDGTVWERGWGEILDRIRVQGFDPSLLSPQYFDQHRIMRFDGHYIDATSSAFVKAYDDLLRRLVLARYLDGATRVVELGCGTGTSQLILADLLPHAELVAADWASPSQDIIRMLAAHTNHAIRPVRLNMLTLEGFDELAIDRATAVLSVHALEQLGGNWGPLLDKLLEVKPKLCLHLEPVLELYDESILFDFLAAKYHRRRNYLHGWLSRLRELEAAGRVEITEERRLGFGDRYHEAYSVLAWRPL